MSDLRHGLTHAETYRLNHFVAALMIIAQQLTLLPAMQGSALAGSDPAIFFQRVPL
jgi:hypothetical protein